MSVKANDFGGGPESRTSIEPPSRSSRESTPRVERPFAGLRAFTFADRAFFFGRERQVSALRKLLQGHQFVALIGGSGCGKSSLVLAGLSSVLIEESADGSPGWVVLDMRPGNAPLQRLARTLSRLSMSDGPEEAQRAERIELRLRQSSFSFDSAVAEAGGLGGRSLLLVIDQFEELFRFGLAGLDVRSDAPEETQAREDAIQFVQILLDAAGRRLRDVHILITMRSDFIGDCSYFYGLPEAVSAAQYLVPNLTRGELEDAIRKPIETVGASIEPELIERLINDCGRELDQLPMLQHCLMRLWDRASKDSAGRPPRIVRSTYEDIGRMAEALSRHADEALEQCGGRGLAVQQTFRALSELDREGRATRRPLRFDRLVAESGVPEDDIRAVVDRFRAPDCSFLVPPLSAPVQLVIQPEDRVDIGHESLLRRWKRLAGSSRGEVGWLALEQADGQHYRTLFSLLDGERAILTDPERTKSWWDSLPRTAAWADRYGGRFDEVRKFIADSIRDKRRKQVRARILAGGLALVGFLIAAALINVSGLRAYWPFIR